MTTGYDFWDMPGAGHSHGAMDTDGCWARLSTQVTGRVGFVRDGRVIIFPVNNLVHDRAVYFRTSSTGDLGRGPLDRVAFQVDEANPAAMSGWSVLMQGSSAVVEDKSLLATGSGRAVSSMTGSFRGRRSTAGRRRRRRSGAVHSV